MLFVDKDQEGEMDVDIQKKNELELFAATIRVETIKEFKKRDRKSVV